MIKPPLPETNYGFPQRIGFSNPQIFLPGREEPAIMRLIETRINQQHAAVIGFGANAPADGLEHPVHAT